MTELTAQHLAAHLRIAKAHREHERHAASEALRHASELRRWSDAMTALGRHWLTLDPPDDDAKPVESLGPMYAAAGIEDLNAPVTVATAGILFMDEGEEPYEVGELRSKLTELVERCAHEGDWAGSMVDVGWKRESPLMASGALVEAAYHRCLTLMRTTLHAGAMSVVGNLLRAARTAVDQVPFDDLARLRSGLRDAGTQVLVAAWLVDQAIALRVEAAAELSRSDPDWTYYIDALTRQDAANRVGREAR